MKGNPKVSTGGPAVHRAPLLLFAALMVVSALGALTAPPASAATTHVFLERFGSVAKPSFTGPKALAVDQSNEKLLVMTSSQILRFNFDGTPANFSALGSNAIEGIAAKS